MSALPVPISLALEPTKSPPVPRGVGFIPLSEASSRSGMPPETLAGKCRREWATIGLACILPPQSGGKACWHVREDADARFARCKSPDLFPIDWTTFTEKQRATVRRRREIIREWFEARCEDFERGYRERDSTTAFVVRVRDGGERVSRGTLYRWSTAFQAAGFKGLADGRMIGGHDDPDADAFVTELKRLFLAPRGRTKRLCYDMALEKAEEKGWSVPFGPRQAFNVLTSIPKKVTAFHRNGPRDYAANHGKFTPRDYSNLSSNEVWVSDGYTFDVSVNVNGKLMRPTLVSWMDMRSRYPVGWKIVARAENADVILAAFRMGVQAHGLPDVVYHDNGKAYDAATLQGMSKQRRRRGGLPDVDLGVFPRLEVKVKHSLPYNAKAKTVERWHRTIKERFCTRFDTYTGGSPDEKPFDLEANKHAGKAPTLEELIEDFTAWLKVDYCNKEHGGVDMNGTPAEVLDRNFDRPERPIEESLLKLETCRRELLKVGRNGVSWRGMTYESPELDRMTGEQVYFVIDDQDVNAGTVLFASGAKLGLKICEATLLRRLDVLASEEDVREAESEKRRDMRKIKEAGPARIRMADDPRERLHRKAALRTGHVLPSPASLVPHRSKFDRPALRLVDDEPAGVGTFGYYGQYADEPARAVNE